MKSIKGTETEKNLLKSFAGELQARERYTTYSKVAKKEGFEQIAANFIETADQEREHAKIFFKFLEGGDVEIRATYPTTQISSTADNLRAAASGENEEWSDLYPHFAEVAEAEGFPKVAAAYRLIAKIEAEHEKRYSTFLRRIEENSLFEREETVRWKCRNCGHIHEGTSAPDLCPACAHPKAFFEEDSFKNF